MSNELILGIETSCDETAAAVVRGGTQVLSNVVHSQVELHREWGGIVPELASRRHAEQIDIIINLALEQAGVGIRDINAVAATYGPGLIGALLVGVSAAKALALTLDVPFVGIDHVEAHIHSVALTHSGVPYPSVSLVVSGGHTSLFFQEEPFRYELVARTRDDAAGEAYDKVAKLLGLGYPGGPVIDRLAALGNPSAVAFSPVKISDGSLDLSFSGIKTAILHLSKKNPEYLNRDIAPEDDQSLLDLLASFQAAVVREIVGRVEAVVSERGAASVGVSGGVANNRGLRQAMAALGERRGLPVLFPDPMYTSDNAAMIAALAWHRLRLDGPSSIELNPVPNLRLAEPPGARRHPRSG
jgi:N6-L-threonylcarbamoyladenine synthase